MTIYVENLSCEVCENDLQEVLEEYGLVEFCKIARDRDSGESKGFAFIEMPNETAGAKAIVGLNGSEFKGRSLILKEERLT